MSFAARVKSMTMVAALMACPLAMPGFAESQRDVTPSPLLPLSPMPEPIPVPSPVQPPSHPAEPGAIGTAEMDTAGNIHLHLRVPTQPPPEATRDAGVPWSAPQERLGYGEIELDRLNPHYNEVLQHLTGLAPGEVKSVPPWRAGEEWHCALDPYRGPCPTRHLLPDGIALR